MPQSFILGSGIMGLAARHMLGDSWGVIPFSRSRFYSFEQSLTDDFIVVGDDASYALANMGIDTSAHPYSRAYSIAGNLIFADLPVAKDAFISKLFGDYPHPAAEHLLKMEFSVFNITPRLIYKHLLKKYHSNMVEENNKYGEVLSIKDHIIHTSKGSFEYDRIISTVPLDLLMGYLGQTPSLQAKDHWYYHVATPSLDFEGADQVLVADEPFDFYKVTHLGNDQYLFFCLQDLGNPETYLGAFLNNRVMVINQTKIDKALPVGAPPDLSQLESDDIYCVGCHAQWDTFMDVSSSLKRLRRVANVG